MQTVVNDAPALGSPGDLADFYTASDGDIVSHANGEASAPIVVGTMVKLDASDGTVVKLTSDNDIPFGIVTRAHAYADSQLESLEVDTDVFMDALTPGTMIGIGRIGRYKVLIEDDVALTDEVHVRGVATTGEIAGAFSPGDLGTDGFDISAFARWVVAGSVDDTGWGVAVVEVFMPVATTLTATDS